jgi:hypothetical protein
MRGFRVGLVCVSLLGSMYARAEKKGALQERVKPATDVKAQEANVEKLKQNAAAERKNGNRVGALAAERDAKHARRLIDKDRELLKKGESKRAVDGKNVKK